MKISENITPNVITQLTSLLRDIADAIRVKTASTTAIAPSKYASIIRDIQNVSILGKPTDWLELPEPEDNEIYMLLHIPSGGSERFAFKVNAQYSFTVEVGTIVDGAFVAAKSREIEATAVSPGLYEDQLNASDFGNLTSDGRVQAVIHITAPIIYRWVNASHSGAPNDHRDWYIVEIKGRCPMANMFMVGDNRQVYALSRLRYFYLYGENQLKQVIFRNCVNLEAVYALDTSHVPYMGSMFYNCPALMVVPVLDASSSYAFTSMFYNCTRIKQVQIVNAAGITQCPYMFYNAVSLVSPPTFDTSQVTDMTYMYNTCTSLQAIPVIDLASVTLIHAAFAGCQSLQTIRFTCSNPSWTGLDLDFTNAFLHHDAIVEMFNSLPTITTTHKITLTGNPGASELTDAEKTIVTDKGWTLTL